MPGVCLSLSLVYMGIEKQHVDSASIPLNIAQYRTLNLHTAESSTFISAHARLHCPIFQNSVSNLSQ